MSHLPCFLKVRELNAAMRARDYDKIAEMLADPLVPVNLGFHENFSSDFTNEEFATLPLDLMFHLCDPRMAQLFLDCPRIDWLAHKSDRNLIMLQDEYGFQYESTEVSEDLEFDYLSHYFLSSCPEESALIYEKIIDEIAKTASQEILDNLLLKSCKSFIAFKAALKYSSNVNVRNRWMPSILHLTSDINVALIALEKGADIESLDVRGDTPLLCHIRNLNSPIVQLLIDRGANLDHINDCGQSAFCCTNYSTEFIDRFGLSEIQFKAVLRERWMPIDSDRLEKIFEKYPKYREIWKENLPLYLASSDEHKSSKYFEDFNEQQYIEYVKLRMKPWITMKDLWNKRPEWIKKHANELLHEAARAGFSEMIIDLIENYGADPNCIENGKTPTFVTTSMFALFALLDNGADPYISCDGYMFFERDDLFKTEKLSIDLGSLKEFSRFGIDFFAPGAKSGKSLLGHLKQDLNVKFGLSPKDGLGMPVSKLSNITFEVLSSKPIDFLAPIDEDGNCLAHYAAQSYNLQDSYYRDRSQMSETQEKIFQSLSVADLKNRAINKAGQSAYSVILESKFFFEFTYNVKDAEILKQFVTDCISKHGESFLRQRGGQLLLYSFRIKNFAFADYLCDEMGVSLDRIIKNRTVAEAASQSEELVYYVSERQKLPFYRLNIAIKQKEINILKHFLENVINISPYIEYFCDKYEFQVRDYYMWKRPTCREEGFQTFMMHTKVRNALAPGSLNWCTVLSQNYFRLCDSDENVQFFGKIGADARKLIGSGLSPKLPKYLCQMDPMLPYFAKAGWKLSDFKALSLEVKIRTACPNFIKIFKEDLEPVLYLSLNVQEEIPYCRICKTEFNQNDIALKFDCNHVLHFNCAQKYVEKTDNCPICMSPHKRFKE